MTTSVEVRTVRVWDVFVRLFHWLLVAAIGFAWWSGEQGGEWMVWHMRAGYTVLGLVIFRLLWGFAGSFYARFSQFVQSPGSVLSYAGKLVKGQEAHYAGHNPVGGWAVLLLLLLCALQAVTGLFANDEIFTEGPLVHLISYDLSVEITRWHKMLFNGLLAVIGVHLLGVMFHQFLRKEKLVPAMVTGNKKVAEIADAAPATAPGSRMIVGLMLVLAAGLLVWGIISL